MVVPDLSNIQSTFRRLLNSLTKQDDSIEDILLIQLQIFSLFLEISKSIKYFNQSDAHYIKKIYTYIKHHLNQRITLDDIAAEVGYHKSYLASQFKKYTGKTIIQTVNELRITKSLSLLRDSNYSILEIAKLAGFPSYAQMVHEFNKSLSLSPRDCRKAFLHGEIDYDSPQYQSIAIRIKEEDFALDDETFKNSFYKKNIHSKSQELLKR